MGLWAIHQAQGKPIITIHALPLIVAAAGAALWVSRSIAVLLLYRGNSSDES